MYWTTPTSSPPPHLHSSPLTNSPAEYINAIRALACLTTPLSAQLLPLLPVYTALRAAQVPSLTYLFSLDEQIAHTELEELYARIVLLWQEMRGHYVEFCCLCADRCVGEVLGFVREVGESAKVWCAGVGNEWEDLGWSMEEERLIRFVGEGVGVLQEDVC
ncbi:hypothetical protein DPSP01_004132 [Paraphaeosphaeria sporulosa]